MIKYPENIHIRKFTEFNVGKERTVVLERILRLLGNFEKNQPIIISDYEESETYGDTILKIKDKNNTIFSFMNFGLGDALDETRYTKNFYLTMQRENSNFIYKYDFSNLIFKLDFLPNFELMQISYSISESRKLNLKRGTNKLSILEIKETDKKYQICFSGITEEDDKADIGLLESFETLIERIKLLDVINLENIFKIIENNKKIICITIDKEEKELASIVFSNGVITRYNINEPNRNIEVTLYSKIIRNIERSVDDVPLKIETEISNENYEILQTDYKRLFKEL